jgi:glycosyl transferase family 25
MAVEAFVIHLPRMPERYQSLAPLLTQLGLPFSIVEGVDGSTLDPDTVPTDASSIRKFCGQSQLGTGTLACYLSHVKAWKTFLASGRRFGLICEDDIRFCPQEFAAALKGVIDQENLWDICSFQLNHRGCPLPLKFLAIQSLATKPLTLPKEGWSLCYYMFNVTGAGAYLINQNAAEKLLAKALPIRMPLDHFYTQSHLLKLRFVGLEPRLVHQDASDSEIDKLGREQKKQASFPKRLRCAMYRLCKDIKAGGYNFYQWICAWTSQKLKKVLAHYNKNF